MWFSSGSLLAQDASTTNFLFVEIGVDGVDGSLEFLGGLLGLSDVLGEALDEIVGFGVVGEGGGHLFPHVDEGV